MIKNTFIFGKTLTHPKTQNPNSQPNESKLEEEAISICEEDILKFIKSQMKKYKDQS
jgi:hypothetical protein